MDRVVLTRSNVQVRVHAIHAACKWADWVVV